MQFKRLWLRNILLIGGILFITGCATGKWEKVEYLSPASTVNFKTDPKICILPLNKSDSLLNYIVLKLSQQFAASKKITIDDENPDYILALNLQHAFRFDDDQQKKYNSNYSVKSIDNKSSGHDVLIKTDKSSTSNATFVSVVLYEVKTLTPKCSFEILLYDSDLTCDKQRDRVQYTSLFVTQIIEKLKEAFITQYRYIDTYIPFNADKEMLNTFSDKQYQKFIERSQDVLSDSFEKFIVAVKAGEYEDKEDQLEETLSNYYLLTIVREMIDFSPDSLQDAFGRQLKIMQITNNEALIMGCANSLGRIENKWRMMNNTDIGGTL